MLVHLRVQCASPCPKNNLGVNLFLSCLSHDLLFDDVHAGLARL